MSSEAMLGLPDLPRIQLACPPLRLVVCQVQFETSVSIEDPSIVAPIQLTLKPSFPRVGLQPAAVSVQFGPKGMQQQTKGQWIFSDDDNAWTVSLAASALTLQTRSYARFEDFEERFSQAASAVFAHLEVARITRFGLRFINEIRQSSSSMGLERIIRAELLGPLSEPIIETHTVRMVTELQLQDESDAALVVRYGRILNGTTVPLPDDPPLDDQYFLLDLDTFDVSPEDGSLPISVDSLSQRLTRYHRNAYRFFRWAVSTEYLEELAKP